MSDNQIVEIVTQNELEPAKGELLLKSFQNYFNAASLVVSEAREIQVKDEHDTASMYEARTKRLELSRIRIDAEKTRKALKEGIVREGKAIDGVANVLKAIIAPVEERLEQQEKFAELIFEKRKQEKLVTRMQELSQYVDDASVYALADITDELYAKILGEAKASKEEKILLAQKAEEARIEQEKKEREERERIAIENERLKKEMEEQRKKQEAERLEAEKKMAEERAKADEALRVEREARMKIEEEQRKKQEAEIAEQRRVEEEARLAQEAERQKTLAPDKEKLLEFAESLKTFATPALSTAEGLAVMKKVESSLLKLSQVVKEEALKL
jgi:hypothetical protein